MSQQPSAQPPPKASKANALLTSRHDASVPLRLLSTDTAHSSHTLILAIDKGELTGGVSVGKRLLPLSQHTFVPCLSLLPLSPPPTPPPPPPPNYDATSRMCWNVSSRATRGRPSPQACKGTTTAVDSKGTLVTIPKVPINILSHDQTPRLPPFLSQMRSFRFCHQYKALKSEQPATQPATQSVSSQPASQPNQSVGRSVGRSGDQPASQPAKRPTVANRFGHVISSRWLCTYSCKRILSPLAFKPRAD
ncbi:unnamed protein product [Hydatigera taeniaeformis]|uniref:Uncharacterized protein n=1 Tax=Hydatigena taeniaeformis TaxID=6205 RepID=A0A158RE16_HYDTA|nr:unnamed protein product [Hydatigera taeniaeformis]